MRALRKVQQPGVEACFDTGFSVSAAEAPVYSEHAFRKPFRRKQQIES
jgi:hypothetical protein